MAKLQGVRFERSSLFARAVSTSVPTWAFGRLRRPCIFTLLGTDPKPREIDALARLQYSRQSTQPKLFFPDLHLIMDGGLKVPLSLPEGWKMLESKSHGGCHYFFHAALGISQWERPSSSLSGSKRPRASESLEGSGNRAKVAVIVPFRDLDIAQKRQEHLNIFIPSLSCFLENTEHPFCIYIVEQSNDNRKFNRGKLLNIGFEAAVEDGCDVFVFHDVDLIPSQELAQWYTTIPQQPAHVARVWNRYAGNPSYFGGVVAFSCEQFRNINGFPNNFWGWGGEDDEMMLRVQACKYKPIHPLVESKAAGAAGATHAAVASVTRAGPDSGKGGAGGGGGTYLDLEENSLEEKIEFLRSNATLKCMNKTEVLDEHEQSWITNGLSSLAYAEVGRVRVGSDTAGSVKITVDVGLNGHWTDLVCANDERQRSVHPDQAKAEWAKSQSHPPGR
jgi:hypothetical protein